MKSNRTEEMNYEKISQAMRYHYGNQRNGGKGHLAMVRDRRFLFNPEPRSDGNQHLVTLTKPGEL